MAARAIWKAVIRFGEVEVPVKLYSAVEDRSVHFRLLHEEDLVPVKQHMVNPDTGDPVPYGETLRAYETEEGELVILNEDDLDAIEPEPSREIEVTRFLDPHRIDHSWFDRPYFLGPDGRPDRYAALARALGEADRGGIARWVMRNKEYRGSLLARGDRLMLVTLHAAEEIVDASALDAPEGRDLKENEARMAKQLVEALADDFDPAEYEDEYRNRVMELIEAKDAGEVVEFREPEPEEPERDLTAALEASLESAGRRRSA